MELQTLKSIKNTIKGKTVLVRVGFDVPLDKQGNITNDSRIKASLSTIEFLIKQKCRIILMSHLGRPDGKVVKELKMDVVAKRLSEILKKEVKKVDACIGSDVTKAVELLSPGEILMLENLRFYPEEEKNDQAFAKKLAALADFYVNDAFSVSHREHSSMVSVPKYIPGCAGFLVEEEIKNLEPLLKSPKKPFVAIIGGAKISDKIPVIESLIDKADAILIGGAMMFTFQKALGFEVGKSKYEPDKLKLAKIILKKAKKKIMLPVDVVVADKIDAKAKIQIRSVDHMSKDDIGLDLGPETTEIYKGVLDNAKTVFWNGPLGYFEIDQFATCTNEVAKKIATLKIKNKALTIIGGGDSETAIEKLGIGDQFSHISTGGGASLEFLTKTLPALKVLERK